MPTYSLFSRGLRDQPSASQASAVPPAGSCIIFILFTRTLLLPLGPLRIAAIDASLRLRSCELRGVRLACLYFHADERKEKKREAGRIGRNITYALARRSPHRAVTSHAIIADAIASESWVVETQGGAEYVLRLLSASSLKPGGRPRHPATATSRARRGFKSGDHVPRCTGRSTQRRPRPRLEPLTTEHLFSVLLNATLLGS